MLYETQFLDRQGAGLNPWRYSGSNWTDDERYFGSSLHPDFEDHKRESIACGKCVKTITKYYKPGTITKDELKVVESVMQKTEGHVKDPSYYNMSDSIHPVSVNPISKAKISATLKRKFASGELTPDNVSKFHTPEATAKRAATKKRNACVAYHNPITGHAVWVKTGLGETPPPGYVYGRKKKAPKRVIVNVNAHTFSWQVFKNGELIWEGDNLTRWDVENGDIGLRFKPSGISVNKKYKTTTIGLSPTNTVMIDGVDTGLKQFQYAAQSNKSGSWVCGAIKGGSFRTELSSDVYTATKMAKTPSSSFYVDAYTNEPLQR